MITGAHCQYDSLPDESPPYPEEPPFYGETFDFHGAVAEAREATLEAVRHLGLDLASEDDDQVRFVEPFGGLSVPLGLGVTYLDAGTSCRVIIELSSPDPGAARSDDARRVIKIITAKIHSSEQSGAD